MTHHEHSQSIRLGCAERWLWPRQAKASGVMRAHVLLAASAALVALLISGPATAQSEPTPAQLLEMIEQQQRQLDALKTALELSQAQAKAAEAAAMQAAKTAESKTLPALEHITIGGVVEVEATSTEAFAGNDTSDITLAKVELFVDTQFHELIGTHVQLIYEDDGTETISLDEANFTLGNPDVYPVYLMGGRWKIPFGGGFDTDMSTDPLTLNLGESQESALLVGAAYEGAIIEGYIYNGDTQKAGSGDHINQWGLNVGYGGELEGIGFNIGAGYMNNIADSDGLTTALGNNTAALGEYRSGYEIHGDIAVDALTVRGAYMTAIDSFTGAEVAFNGGGAKPAAWVFETSYTTPILGKDTTFAGTVQGTEEALALGLPETRIGGAVTVGIVEYFSVTGEYLHDTDYGTGDGGTGNTGHTATLKFAAEF